jgi:glycine/D-amino acid oxidase-like deaminating enzyme
VAVDLTLERELFRDGVGDGARRSLWVGELSDLGLDASGLAGEHRADVCIIGGGYTGLWTALRIGELEPAASVIVVEADFCGSGASGRNGGFVLSWWPKLEALVERAGRDEALRLARASEDSIAEIGSFCESEGIDAHFHQGGWVWTATSPAQDGAWRGTLLACERYDVSPFQPLAKEEVQARTGSDVHLGGVLEPSAATVQPALLARGLRRSALARGVRVFEHSPVVALDRTEGVVRTPSGSVRAGVVVLATNAWSARIPDLRRSVVPLSSDVIATEPIPEKLAASGWTGGEAVSDSRLMVHYYRTTQDGRVAFGRGGGALGFAGRFGAEFEHADRRASEIAADLQRLVPAAREAAITHGWAGAVDRSVDGLPFCGRLSGGVPILYGVGFSGNGVGPSRVVARILASAALRRSDEWSESALNRGIPSRFPPEPLRFVGGVLIREAVRRKEEREDRGQSVGLLTHALAARAPSGYFKVTPQKERQGA